MPFCQLLLLLLVLRLVVQEDVLSTTEAKLDDVLLHQLDVPLRLNLLVIDEGSVARLEVEYVGASGSTGASVRFGYLDGAKLKDGMLL